jgi:hypothetical protein
MMKVNYLFFTTKNRIIMFTLRVKQIFYLKSQSYFDENSFLLSSIGFID